MHSDGILNDFELQRTFWKQCLKHTFWRYLKRFGTAEKKKTRTFTRAFWDYLKRYLKLQMRKQYMFILCVWTEIVSSSYMSRLVDARPSPFWPSICNDFGVLYVCDFLEKVVGPGLQGLHVATPVLWCLEDALPMS